MLYISQTWSKNTYRCGFCSRCDGPLQGRRKGRTKGVNERGKRLVIEITINTNSHFRIWQSFKLYFSMQSISIAANLSPVFIHPPVHFITLSRSSHHTHLKVCLKSCFVKLLIYFCGLNFNLLIVNKLLTR